MINCATLFRAGQKSNKMKMLLDVNKISCKNASHVEDEKKYRILIEDKVYTIT